MGSLILELEGSENDVYGGSSTTIAQRRFMHQLLQIDQLSAVVVQLGASIANIGEKMR